MTDQDFIDKLIEEHLAVGQEGNLTDADLRVIALTAAQKSVFDFWKAKPWHWRYDDESVTVSKTLLRGLLPARFASWGKYGTASRDDDGIEITYRAPQAMSRLRAQGRTALKPRFYTNDGMETGQKKLLIYPDPDPSADVVIDIHFEQTRPTLVDSAMANNLREIPAEYHDTVLYDGAVFHLMEATGDARRESKLGQFRSGIATAWMDEKVRHVPRRPLPRYGSRTLRRYLP